MLYIAKVVGVTNQGFLLLKLLCDRCHKQNISIINSNKRLACSTENSQNVEERLLLLQLTRQRRLSSALFSEPDLDASHEVKLFANFCKKELLFCRIAGRVIPDNQTSRDDKTVKIIERLKNWESILWEVMDHVLIDFWRFLFIIHRLQWVTATHVVKLAWNDESRDPILALRVEGSTSVQGSHRTMLTFSIHCYCSGSIDSFSFPRFKYKQIVSWRSLWRRLVWHRDIPTLQATWKHCSCYNRPLGEPPRLPKT